MVKSWLSYKHKQEWKSWFFSSINKGTLRVKYLFLECSARLVSHKILHSLSSCSYWEWRCQSRQGWPHSLTLPMKHHIYYTLFAISTVIENIHYIKFDLYNCQNIFKIWLISWMIQLNCHHQWSAVMCHCTGGLKSRARFPALTWTNSDSQL